MKSMTHLLVVGVVWKDWFGPLEHRLLLDLDTLTFSVDDGTQLVPLTTYLTEHPERGSEVRNVLRSRLS